MGGAADVRRLAFGLGWLGVAPFAGLAAAAAFDMAIGRAAAIQALVLYGAVILSFLGGVSWGLVLAPGARPAPILALVVGVSMSLIGFFAAFAPPFVALTTLAPAFVVMLAFDLWLVRRGSAPGWFSAMRMQLTASAVVAMLVGALVA